MTDLLMTLRAFMPETLMAFGVLLAVVNDLLASETRKREVAWFGAMVAITAMIAAFNRLVGVCGTEGCTGLSGLLAIDGLTHFARIGICGATAIALIAATASRAVIETRQSGEYFISLLGLGLGGLVFASANNLLSVYLGLEMISLTSYVLAGYRHRDRATSEAGMIVSSSAPSTSRSSRPAGRWSSARAVCGKLNSIMSQMARCDSGCASR